MMFRPFNLPACTPYHPSSRAARQVNWEKSMNTTRSLRYDLASIPWLRKILRSREVLFLSRAVLLAGFLFAILAGLLGSQVGSHNFAIIIVWIAWWTVLKLVLIPFGGRAWCTICPIPAPGEWLQQGAMASRGRKGLGLNLSWPRFLRGTWLQTAGFLLIGLFSAATLTRPAVTGWVFLGLFAGALILSLVFERRSFCRYVCPMGGFIGWYSQTAPLEVRVKDRAVCTAHQPKTCYTGCEAGYGCPWLNYPAALQQNNPCGLCMECLRSCPQDNMAVNLRPFGEELKAPAVRRLDEAVLGLVLLASVAAFAAVFLGPWGRLKGAALAIGSGEWLAFAGGFLALVGLVTGSVWAAAWLGKRLARISARVKDLFVSLSYALLPVGFTAWIAFTVSFAFAKLSYIFPVLSDPLGRGWNLFGTAHWQNSPWLVGVTPILETLLLAGGLLWAARLIWALGQRRGGKNGWKLALPTLLLAAAFSAGMMYLLI